MRDEDDPRSCARRLRRDQTPVEQKLWATLRAHRLGGVKFTRQVPIGPHIVDFAARSLRLVIEVDGDTHSRQLDYDAARTRFIESHGYRVIRFTNSDVMMNLEGVARTIVTALRATPSPNPLPGGERARA